MIQLLYMVILGEMALILILLFKTPLRKLVILSLDKVKRGKGPVVVKTVSGTLFIVLLSSVYSMSTIQSRTDEGGALNPTDQVLMAMHMLEASLMGFVLFLALMIDRLHHYIRELRQLRKTMEAVKKQSRGFEDGKSGNADDLKKLEEEVASLRPKVKNMESECKLKANEAKNAVGEAEARKKKSEELHGEYDRLLEDNQNLRKQLEAMSQSSPHSEGKKNM